MKGLNTMCTAYSENGESIGTFETRQAANKAIREHLMNHYTDKGTYTIKDNSGKLISRIRIRG